MTESETLMTDNALARSWRAAAENQRAAIEALGIRVTHCLPGEVDDCGKDDLQHFAAYTATLMARMQWDMFALSHACPGQGTDAFLAELFAHQCCVTAPERFAHIELPLGHQFAILMEAVDEHLGDE